MDILICHLPAKRHFFPSPLNKGCHSERSEESPVIMIKQFDKHSICEAFAERENIIFKKDV
jgi:hypothetical protein